jgi:hypothetical protein
MRIVPAVDAEIRHEIRDARALGLLISLVALEQKLEKKFKRGFSYRYIAKIADKVARRALIEADRTVRAVITATWQRGGLLPKETIDKMAPLQGT